MTLSICSLIVSKPLHYENGANTCQNKMLREIVLYPAFGWGTKPERTVCEIVVVLIFLARRRNLMGKGGGRGIRV